MKTSFFGRVKHLVVTGTLATIAVGCNNYTTAPLCDSTNEAMPNIEGNYSINQQDGETFAITRAELSIAREQDGLYWVVQDGSKAKMEICQIGTNLISQEYDADKQIYSYDHVLIADHALVFAPVMFDTTSLQTAAIPYAIKMISMSEALFWLGHKFNLNSFRTRLTDDQEDSERPALIVDNQGISGSVVLKSSTFGTGGMVYQRR